MAPRPIATIISTMTAAAENENKDINELFLFDIDEIFSHPKDDILSHFVYVRDKDIMQIREKLFIECVKKLAIEGNEQAKLSMATLINSNDGDDINILNRLRKRYKASCCYEDIFIIGTSYIEKVLHKDLIRS